MNINPLVQGLLTAQVPQMLIAIVINSRGQDGVSGLSKVIGRS